MSPKRILPGMFDESESPSAQFLRQREEFRRANHLRIKRTLKDYTVKGKDDKPVPTGFKVNDEKHSMTDNMTEEFDMTPISIPDRANMVRSLARFANESIIHDQFQVPKDSDLPSEDLDGPPIHDLDDENEIFAAIDKVIADAEKERDDNRDDNGEGEQ